MRPFVALNQALGMKAANLMRSKEKKNVGTWLLEQIMRIAPRLFINRSTQRILQATNAIASRIIPPDRANTICHFRMQRSKTMCVLARLFDQLVADEQSDQGKRLARFLRAALHGSVQNLSHFRFGRAAPGLSYTEPRNGMPPADQWQSAVNQAE
jgi:hypothetical protein